MSKYPYGIPENFLDGFEPNPIRSTREPETSVDCVRNGDGSVTFILKKTVYLREETVPAEYSLEWSEEEAVDKACDWASLDHEA
ncbi:hypothetical protein [Brucella pseudogrignonensis]|uniref:hypothetical protein n=1 Tax=Brucella pseudogrignonensis TaxID=419475 RepID=UPI0038D041CB